MKIKSVPVKFKTDGLAEGQAIVYPSTFTRTPDAYGDVVAKGAFAKGIAKRKENGTVLPGLYGHRLDDPDFFVASALAEEEDDHGWRVLVEFDMESPKGAQVYRLVKSGRLRELSFAYDVLDAAMVKLDDGSDAYELRDLDVFEFSFVPVGANRDTSVVAVKSAVDALLHAPKAGRVLSQKNESALRDARDAIDRVLQSLGDEEPKTNPAHSAPGDDQEAETSGDAAGKDEGQQVKSEAPGASPSVKHLGLIRIAAAL